ncbi:CK054-like protein [Mya arenaria]|uniref:CK054-like protein n=1 Tax=Mya arenaria TaxID=6604 RepID=A0ABY7DWH2_MYAAR|nr:CK054-like protein [Mya arenaria]
MTEKLSVAKIPMHVPPMEEVQKVLSDGLSKNFADVAVSVVECPDLTQPPFHLSASGLGGNQRLVDIGGPPFLFPLAQRDKKFTFRQIAELAESKDPFMLGAGAGPAHVVGVNSEMMNTIKLQADGSSINKGYISKVDKQTGGCILEKMPCDEFCLMGNFLVCDGAPGKVLEVKASRRTGEEDFSRCLKMSLRSHYGDKPVGLGGVFLIEKGKAHLHIMSDFSETPITKESQGFDLRDEHFHCFNQQGQGGHYHWDTTPEEVEYRAYFVLPEYVYRIDKPTNKVPWEQ